MLSSILGNDTAEKVLMFIHLHKRVYLREIAYFYGLNTNSVRIQLNKFEEAGLLVSQKEGMRSYYSYNDEYPLYNEVYNLLEKVFELYTEIEKEALLNYSFEREVKLEDKVEFDPQKYTFNYFWQNNNVSIQTVQSIISNYLKSMEQADISMICKEFNPFKVMKVLNDKYKQIHKDGYMQLSGGMSIPVEGKYTDNQMYKELKRMILDKSSTQNT